MRIGTLLLLLVLAGSIGYSVRAWLRYRDERTLELGDASMLGPDTSPTVTDTIEAIGDVVSSD